MRNMSQHTEWLSMIEVSGPFLAVSVLEKIFPQGLESLENYRKRRIRSAYEKTITQKVVTYDFARQMEGATEVKTSEFASALISNL